ncbi:MAG: nucleoside-diphosphate sugar epimerase/dehydratase [Chloroflexota bacterium]
MFSFLSFSRITQVSNGLLRLRNRHFLAVDFLIVCLTPALAIALRVEQLDSLVRFIEPLLAYTLFSVLIRISIFYFSDLYRRYWRFASLDELILIGKASLFSTVVALLAAFLINNTLPVQQDLPRSIPIIDGLLVLLLVGGFRFSVRMAEYNRKRRSVVHPTQVAIYGAGVAGDLCYREISGNPELGLRVVGFFDDDPRKANAHIHRVRVLGNRDDVAAMVSKYGIEQLIVAMPSVPGHIVREIADLCEKLHIDAKTMPGLSEIMSSGFTMDKVREVQIEDLLRREPVRTDVQAIHSLLAGRRVLVTGGGGSIGSELCRQILSCQPEKLVILGHGENSVFEINRELRSTLQQIPEDQRPHIETVIADIRFPERLQNVFRKQQPEIVFHAAAHKHVPLMEQNPSEGVENNILGTRNVLDAAVANDVERFVMISSDKAVNPTNVMGATKRSAELLVHRTAERTGLPYVAVRFGNVLGSRGSVILTFKEQIRRGGPITVTHPEMCRFFMTIPEAVQLVLQAAVMGSGGEVFMLDMGQPVKIVDLARDLVELSGLEVGRDINIRFSGIRPGEKLYEELFIKGETYGRTAHEKIMTVGNAGDLVPDDLDEAVNLLANAALRDDSDAIKRLLQALVPEYQPTHLSEHRGPALAKAEIATAPSLSSSVRPLPLAVD